MNVFIACLATETNSFSPIPTGRQSYEGVFYARGDATSRQAIFFDEPLHSWRKMSEERGWQVIESLCTFAQAAGLTVKEIYEEYRDVILQDLKAAGQVDVVLLSMHGAMMAQGYDDCEGDLLSRARKIVGNACIIGLEIDPHSHLTDAMLENASVIVCYKEYPHTDIIERGEELFTLCARAVQGDIRPVMRDFDCHMIQMYFTPQSPIREFVDDMVLQEGRDSILSLSLVHGFPWGDTARTGTRMLAIADGDPDNAQAVAEKFGRRLWAMREELRFDFPEIPEALDRAARSAKGPIVLGDFADNAGAGAPADATFVLREVLRRKLKQIAIGIFWDPVTVQFCYEAGEGAVLPIRLGGKVGAVSGDPIDITVRVLALRDGLMQKFGDSQVPMGKSALLEADGVFLLVNDMRSQVFDPGAFTQHGLDLAKMKIIVVKSSNHFYAGFAPIAAEVIHMATPGAVPPDFTIIPYQKRDNNYWPKTEIIS